MPDRIDLGDPDITDEADDEERPNRGDWFWGNATDGGGAGPSSGGTDGGGRR